LVLAVTFRLGFTFNNITSTKANHQQRMEKVTGLGGIFFKCKDPEKMKEWYKTHLSLNTNEYGATFEWREESN
jgi:hypothetical protein